MAVNFKYFLRESASSMRRNMALTVAAVLVTTISILFLGGVVMGVHSLNGIATSMKQRVDEIRVFLKEDVTVEERESMERFVRNMSEVSSVKYISKEEALEQFKDWYADNPEILEQIEGNPLPAEFKVTMKDPKYNKAVAQRLEARPEVSTDEQGKKEIAFPEQTVNKVLGWTGAIQKIGGVLVFVFGIVAVALVAITIRMAIYSRRKEIGIMKLVGATNWFIRWPFMFEGVIEGLLASIFAIIFIIFMRTSMVKWLEVHSDVKVLVSGGYFVLLAFILIVFGALIGAVGSAFALTRYVEV